MTHMCKYVLSESKLYNSLIDIELNIDGDWLDNDIDMDQNTKSANNKKLIKSSGLWFEFDPICFNLFKSVPTELSSAI